MWVIAIDMIAKQKSAQAKEASKAAKGMNFYFVLCSISSTRSLFFLSVVSFLPVTAARVPIVQQSEICMNYSERAFLR
jgi:hypothetical protein